jgi:hypothetical protein
MKGTLRQTENGSHPWTSGTTLRESLERLAKLGTVQHRGNEIRAKRFDGGKISAEFFPVGAVAYDQRDSGATFESAAR